MVLQPTAKHEYFTTTLLLVFALCSSNNIGSSRMMMTTNAFSSSTIILPNLSKLQQQQQQQQQFLMTHHRILYTRVDMVTGTADMRSPGKINAITKIRRNRSGSGSSSLSMSPSTNDNDSNSIQTEAEKKKKKREREEEETNNNNNNNNNGGGSIWGAAFLFAGTAIGAGMLALPAETSSAGFIPSISTLIGCWIFTIVTSLITLEATWLVQQQQQQQQLKAMDNNDDDDGTIPVIGFISITKMALGPIGEFLTGVLFWFLLSSIVVAYTSEGGQLLSGAIQELSLAGGSGSGNAVQELIMTPAIGSTLFLTFFAILGIFGIQTLDWVNRILVIGLITSFLGLVGISIPGIQMNNLISHMDWTIVYPQVVSIGILSFGAQNVIPTILQYLGGCPQRTKRAIWIGTLIPLIMYILWELVFLGIVPFTTNEGSVIEEMGGMIVGGDGIGVGHDYDGDDVASKMQIVTTLKTVGGVIVKDLVEVFSVCAVGSSMAGASVSLIDFFQDAISVLTTTTTTLTTASTTRSEDEPQPVDYKKERTNKSSSRLIAATLALTPPLGLALAYPDAFLGALENAGLIGGVSLYGVLPALSVINLRRRNQPTCIKQIDPMVDGPTELETEDCGRQMPGKVIGGDIVLYGVAIVSIAVIIPEFSRLIGQGSFLWT